jgi:hypothetical protein
VFILFLSSLPFFQPSTCATVWSVAAMESLLNCCIILLGSQEFFIFAHSQTILPMCHRGDGGSN